jgi:hypothetical protein
MSTVFIHRCVGCRCHLIGGMRHPIGCSNERKVSEKPRRGLSIQEKGKWLTRSHRRYRIRGKAAATI